MPRSQSERVAHGTHRLLCAALISLWMATGGYGARAQDDGSRVPVLLNADLSGWEPQNFSGVTRYAPVGLDGRRVVKAMSDSTASGLYREIRVDLAKTPVLHWSWRAENTLGDIDETTRGGDDYAARVYVIVRHPVLFWKTRALNYVWSSAQPTGSNWPNAYTENARVVAVRSGEAGLGQWHQERRNVRKDFREFFGMEVRFIDAVAFMTDTDNTGKKASSYYGDIWFAPE